VLKKTRVKKEIKMKSEADLASSGSGVSGKKPYLLSITWLDKPGFRQVDNVA
jgi:hypothetical protein